MTQPIPTVSDVEDIESADFEAGAVAQVAAPVSTSVDEAVSAILALQELAEDEDQEESLRAAVLKLLAKVVSLIDEKALERVVKTGMALGYAHSGANDLKALGKPTAKGVKETLKPLKDSAAKGPKQALDQAVKLAKLLPADEDYLPAVAAATKQVVHKAERLARTAALQAEAAGVIEAAAKEKARVVWVHERGACLHCLAYAGLVTAAGASFGSHTYADKPLALDSLVVEHPDGEVFSPPLHPHCRCRLRVWHEPAPREPEEIPRRDTDTSYAEALQREARRAVLRGSSDYDSLAARLRATERLLELGANLPVSVERRAKRSVDNKSFGR